MKNNGNYDLERFDHITMLRNEKNLDTIRKIVSMQFNMQLNAERYNAGLIDRELYAKNVGITQEAFTQILENAKKDLDYLTDYEKEMYEALMNKKES